MSYFENKRATTEDEIVDLGSQNEEIRAGCLKMLRLWTVSLQRDLMLLTKPLLEKWERYEYLSELGG